MGTDDERVTSARLRGAARSEPTCPEVGATTGVLPAGYRHVRRSRDIGDGVAAFDSAAARLLRWDVHRAAGLDVEATSDSAVDGSTVVLGLRAGPLRVLAPCRVVLVVDEPRRRGFAYGTLPGHPEMGEELFLLTLGARDRVTFTVTAFSRPAAWWVRLGGPVAHRVQDRVTARYVASLAGTG